MTTRELEYGHVNSETDLRQIFSEIRGDVGAANSREELTQLYRRAEYLIALTYAPAWQKKFDGRLDVLRRTGEAEFATVARAINRRAAEIGTSADYDEAWGPGR
jgi:hypothetical protein